MSVIEREQAPAEIQAPITERDVLVRAADLLEEFGWCQDIAGSKHQGEMCALQAISEASCDLGAAWLYGTARQRVFANDRGSFVLIAYNDKPGRAKAEVVTALREAAERA